MLEDLTPEEYARWCQSYQQDPWGDSRADARQWTMIRWLTWRPSHEGEEPDLPSPFFPYFKSKEEKTAEEVETYAQLKARAMEARQRLKEKKDGN